MRRLLERKCAALVAGSLAAMVGGLGTPAVADSGSVPIPEGWSATHSEALLVGDDGATRWRHNLAIDGVPVENLDLVFEVDDDGELRPLSIIELAPGLEALSVQPTLQREEAETRLFDLPGFPPYPGEGRLRFRAEVERFVPPTDAGEATSPFVRRVSGLRLVWQVPLYARPPFSPGPGRRLPSAREIVTIDAQTGEILETVDNRVYFQAAGHGFHHPNVAVEASYVDASGAMCLGDRTRPEIPWSGFGCVEPGEGLSVSTYRGSGMELGRVISADGAFGDGIFATDQTPYFVNRFGELNALAQTTAVDALIGLENAYDFYREVFGRVTLGRAGWLDLYVNIPAGDEPGDLATLNNAWIERLDDSIWVGLSDAAHPERKPASDLKSMAHEYSHLVLASRLGYGSDPLRELDAFEEGFADVMALLADTWARNPAGQQRLEPARWVVGESVSPELEFQRFFHRPSLDGRSVDAWGQSNAQGVPWSELEAHLKGGVLRRWFFFLARGVERARHSPSLPSATYHDLGSVYLPRGLEGIGVRDAALELYRHALTLFDHQLSGFEEARDLMEIVASQAGERCSPREKAIRDAWAAVNVGEPADRDPPAVTVDAWQDGQMVHIRATAHEQIDTDTVRLEINGQPRGMSFGSPQLMVDGVRHTGTVAIVVSDIIWSLHALQTIELTLDDLCRNSTTVRRTVEVDKSAPDIESVADEALYRSSSRSFRFEASDPSGVSAIQLAVGGTSSGLIGLDPAPNLVDRIVVLDLDSEPHGIHTVVATARDRHGNTATRSFSGYLVDRQAPERCELSSCGHWGSDTPQRGYCALVSWDGANDNDVPSYRGGIQQMTVWIDNQSFSALRGQAADAPMGYWATPAPPHWRKLGRSPVDLEIGEHLGRGQCIDGWGNGVAAPPRSFIISDSPSIWHTSSWSNGTFSIRARGSDLPDIPVGTGADSMKSIQILCNGGLQNVHATCPANGPPCDQLEVFTTGPLAAGQSASCDITAYDVYGSSRKGRVTITGSTNPPPPPPPPPGTGDLSFRLIWHGPSDLDLFVKEPNGDVISWMHRISSTGGVLDVDANYPCGQTMTPIENVYWPAGSAPHGTYEYWVVYQSSCGDSERQLFQVEIRQGTSLVLTQGDGVDEGGGESDHYTYSY